MAPLKYNRRMPRLRFRPAVILADALVMVLAALLTAVSLDLFLAPSEIAPGGVSGLAIILNRLAGRPGSSFSRSTCRCSRWAIAPWAGSVS
jgi:uncharacterized membrane-anchored protein YitT (DUF2179 family)